MPSMPRNEPAPCRHRFGLAIGGLVLLGMGLGLFALPPEAFGQFGHERGDRPPHHQPAPPMNGEAGMMRGMPGMMPPGPDRRPRLVEAAYLGVRAEPIGTTLKRQLDLDYGLTLLLVAEDSPAQHAGLEPHDILLSINDQMLINREQLAALVRVFGPGEPVELAFLRGGERHAVEVELGERALPELMPGGFVAPGGMSHGIAPGSMGPGWMRPAYGGPGFGGPGFGRPTHMDPRDGDARPEFGHFGRWEDEDDEHEDAQEAWGDDEGEGEAWIEMGGELNGGEYWHEYERGRHGLEQEIIWTDGRFEVALESDHDDGGRWYVEVLEVRGDDEDTLFEGPLGRLRSSGIADRLPAPVRAVLPELIEIARDSARGQRGEREGRHRADHDRERERD